jgi:uncharacterized membrane protein YedE/YeeE
LYFDPIHFHNGDMTAMDLVPLIDLVGEPQTALVGGLVLGLAFGVFAQRSRFCTRSAVLSAMGEGDLKPLATWAAGFAAAILAVHGFCLAADQIDVDETRFFSTAQSLSGAMLGGLLFGVGMVLARGCVSRLMVLGASGNLRGVFSIAIVAVTALATYSGVLVPLRDGIGGFWSTASIGGNDLLAHLGVDRFAGLALGTVSDSDCTGAGFQGGIVDLAAVWWRSHRSDGGRRLVFHLAAFHPGVRADPGGKPVLHPPARDHGRTGAGQRFCRA